MDFVIRTIALALIRAYQRWISPHKGFACAHRLRLGGSSCSQVGARLIRRHGLRKGLPLLRERLLRCGDVQCKAAPRYRPVSARGDCDCGSADLDCFADCCECGSNCNLFDSARGDPRREQRTRRKLASRR